jgi:hypothetical protein
LARLGPAYFGLAWPGAGPGISLLMDGNFNKFIADLKTKKQIQKSIEKKTEDF